MAMKNKIILTICIIMLIAFKTIAQSGGIRSIKTISDKIIFKDLSGSGDKLIGIDNNGRSKKINVDGSTIALENDTIKSFYHIQNLSGTSVTWNLANGRDAKITLTGNTTITLINAIVGTTGTLWVTNPTTVYTIQFAGYTNSIDPFIRLNNNIVLTSGGGKFDDYTFKYNGIKMNWNGTLDRH